MLLVGLLTAVMIYGIDWLLVCSLSLWAVLPIPSEAQWTLRLMAVDVHRTSLNEAVSSINQSTNRKATRINENEEEYIVMYICIYIRTGWMDRGQWQVSKDRTTTRTVAGTDKDPPAHVYVYI